MTTENSVGAASDAKMNRPTIDWRQIHCNVRRLQVRIVKATQEGRWGKVGTHQHLLSANRVLRRALERLERAAGKLARRVLRGRGGSNVALLSDFEKKALMVEESSQSIGEPQLRYLLRNLSNRCSAYKHAHMVNYAGGAGAETQGVM